MWILSLTSLQLHHMNVVTKELLKSQTDKRELYRYLSLIVVFLQYIVAARWYLCEYHQTWTMAAYRDLLGQHNVFFLFLAFRVGLMYLLPYKYFVQRIPSSLPTYAKEQQFALPLQKLFEAISHLF